MDKCHGHVNIEFSLQIYVPNRFFFKIFISVIVKIKNDYKCT